jgi:hypothetical protein
MTCKLHMPRFVLIFGVLSLFTVIALTVIAFTITGRDDVPPLFVVVIWCAILAWNWFVVLGIPYRIEFNGPDDISFIALRKTVRTSAQSTQSVKNTNGGMYLLRYDGGKIHLFQQFTGFYKLLTAIEAANPRFETRGI